MVTLTKFLVTDLYAKEDTHIRANSGLGEDTNNYGENTFLPVGTWNDGAGAVVNRSLLQIKMPEEPENAKDITQIRLGLYNFNWGATPTMAIRECNLEYVGGYTDSFVPPTGATWVTYDGLTRWTDDTDGGKNVADIGVLMSDYQACTTIVLTWFDITKWARKKNFTWASTQNCFLKLEDGQEAGSYVRFYSANYTTDVTLQPKIEVTYTVEHPEIPDGEDEILTVEFNPANPQQSLLKWKKPENQSLRIDNKGAYVLVKSETIIDAITDGTLIARLNQGEEYIDTGGVLATTENNLYYYKLYFCSESDYIDGTGTGLMSGMTIVGTPIASNQVWMIRPDITSFVFDDYTPDVKQQVTATITAVVAGDFASTPSPVQHTHYQYDWKGDSTESGWVELETPANSHAKTHYYLGYQGATSAKARIQNSLGFWSDATNSGSTVTVAAITGIPIVNVSPKAMTISETILRILGDQSYARSSNETITKYEFRVIRGSDSYEWDFDKAPSPDWIVASPTWNDLTTTPYMDIPSGDMDTAATYTCYVRITTSSFGLSSTTDNTTMVVSTETSTDMKSTLANSVFKTHSLGAKRVKSRHRVIEGTTEIVIDAGREMPQIRISGDSYGINFQTDYTQLITWRDADTLLKVYTDPQASAPAKYIEGWIDNLTFSKRLSESVHWECTLVSKTASL